DERQKEPPDMGPQELPGEPPDQRCRLAFHSFQGSSGGGPSPQGSPLQAPATVMPSIRTVRASFPVLNSRSSAAASLRYMSCRFPATVTSLTGKASSPLTIQNPAAPRL